LKNFFFELGLIVHVCKFFLLRQGGMTMKEFLISGLVIGALVACPVAFAAEPANTEQAEKTLEPAHPVKHKAKHHKRHGKKHHVKRHKQQCKTHKCTEHRAHHAKKHPGKKHHAKHMSSTETSAEKKVNDQTDLNTR
jgi:hypothetical protein